MDWFPIAFLGASVVALVGAIVSTCQANAAQQRTFDRAMALLSETGVAHPNTGASHE